MMSRPTAFRLQKEIRSLDLGGICQVWEGNNGYVVDIAFTKTWVETFESRRQFIAWAMRRLRASLRRESAERETKEMVNRELAIARREARAYCRAWSQALTLRETSHPWVVEEEVAAARERLAATLERIAELEHTHGAAHWQRVWDHLFGTLLPAPLGSHREEGAAQSAVLERNASEFVYE